MLAHSKTKSEYFTREQEELITKVEEQYPFGYWWKHSPESWYKNKWVALIDIYGGQYPDLFKKDETLFNEYSNKLIKHCQEKDESLSIIWKVKNSILQEYVDARTKERETREKEEEAKNSIVVPLTTKKHLQELQKKFSPIRLYSTFQSEFSRKKGIYLYSNDIDYVPYYLEVADFTKKPIILEEKTFNLLDALNLKNKQHKIGIILGNGFVLSLLPEIPADDILLLDVEPTVHYFLLQVRNLILQADESKDFFTFQKEMIADIKKLELKIYHDNSHKSSDINIEQEIWDLGDKHFLASPSRFKICKKALQKKELLPVKIDIFNIEKMEQLSKTLNKTSCKVSFLNITNIADYDKSHVLISSLKKLPLEKNYKIISTALIGYPSRGGGRKAFMSTTPDELSSALEYSYYKTTPRQFSYSWGWKR